MLRKKLAGFLGILMVSVSVLAGCSDAKADKAVQVTEGKETQGQDCLLYTSPSPRDPKTSRMPSSA